MTSTAQEAVSAVSGVHVSTSSQSVYVNAITKYECALYGVLPVSYLNKCRERLLGICSKETPFNELEVAFVPTTSSKPKKATTVQRVSDVILRLRSNINSEVDEPNSTLPLEKRQWRLVQLGHPETGAKRTTTIRSIVDVEIKGNAWEYMHVLGCAPEFEFVRKGYVYSYKNRITITLTQIYKVDSLNVLQLNTVPLDDTHWLVEVNGISPQEGVFEMGNELHAFGSYLTGIVDLVHVDHKILQQKVA